MLHLNNIHTVKQELSNKQVVQGKNILKLLLEEKSETEEESWLKRDLKNHWRIFHISGIERGQKS